MSVNVDRETLALDLRTYGEDKVAERVLALDNDVFGRIHERADHYLYKEVALAARERRGAGGGRGA